MRPTSRYVTVSCGLLLACAALTPLAGCGDVVAREPVDVARDDARDKARSLVQAIDRDHGYRADQYAHSAAQVDGVEVMSVDGTTRNEGDGVTLIVRIHGVAPTMDLAGRMGGPPLDQPFCFRIGYDRDAGDPLRGEVDCPATPPLAIAKDPELPDDIDALLRDRLPRGHAATEAAVRAVVDGLDLDARILRQVTSDNGTIGVALRASQYGCVMARVTARGVEVWRPSRIQLAPGELSCTAANATAGAGQHPPH